MEIVTGKAGVPHVSSADDGRRIAGEVGTGSYVLQTGGKLAPSLVDANTVRFATGDMIVQGRHIGVTVPEDVKVASGSQGKKRMDYICVHYSRDVGGSAPTLVETVNWKVLQGTPGTTATAPSVPRGFILNGDSDVTVPICSVSFDGLTTGQPKLLIPELTPLADLGDSVSRSFVSVATRGGEIQFARIGGLVAMNLYNVTARISGSWSGEQIGTVPEGFRPKTQLRQRCVVANSDREYSAGLWIKSSGEMFISNFGGTGLSGQYSFSCCVAWPA
mgnify:CR=1 FL=1